MPTFKAQDDTKKAYETYLNELGVPEEDKFSEGGRIPDRVQNWGTWMRRNDPVAFQVGYQEWKDFS